jgi:ABC-2 type transport system ATP-binding protein
VITSDGAVALSAKGLAKKYGKRTLAVTGLDVDIPEGTITALVGPNGAGKSTLMKTWIGFERPTRGSVQVRGIDPWRDRSRALNLLGYVSQSPSLYRELSVGEHLDLAAHYRPEFDRTTAVRRLDDLSIPLGARAGELSGGQAAQVGLALALGTGAPILLLDEPLAGLDPLARLEFLAILVADNRATGRTIVLSSHVVSDVRQACDRLLLLANGRKMLDGSIADQLAAHAVVQSSVEAPPPPGFVARIPGESGSDRVLVRKTGSADGVGGAAPALEDIVLAYLAAGRAAQKAEA